MNDNNIKIEYVSINNFPRTWKEFSVNITNELDEIYYILSSSFDDIASTIHGLKVYIPQKFELSQKFLIEWLNCLVNLQELQIINLDISKETVKAILNRSDTINSLSIIHSKLFGDKDLRVLSSKCQKLKYLKISYCPLITTQGLAKLSLLHELKVLILSNLNGIKELGFIKYFVNLKIEELQLCYLRFMQPSSVQDISSCFVRSNNRMQSSSNKMKPITFSLFSISLRGCTGIPHSVFTIFLGYFLHCITFDFTGCFSENIEEIKNINPFVKSFSSVEFSGFKLLDSKDVNMFTSFWDKMQLLRFNTSRIIIKRRVLNYILNKRLERLLNIEKTNTMRMKSAILIQATIRCWIQKQIYVKQLYAAGIISQIVVKWYVTIVRKSYYIAVKWNVRRLKRFLFGVLRKYLSASNSVNSMMLLKVQELSHRYLCYKMLLRWLIQSEYIKEKYSVYKNLPSRFVWKEVLIQRIFKHWKYLLMEKYSITKRKKKLIAIFLNIIDFSYHNSSRQVKYYEISQSFDRIRLQKLIWTNCFMAEYNHSKAIDKLLPQAKSHFYNKFLHRVMKPCFLGFKECFSYQMKKKRFLEIAYYAFIRFHCRYTILNLRYFQNLSRSYHSSAKLSISYFKSSQCHSFMIKRLIPFTVQTLRYKLLLKKAKSHYRLRQQLLKLKLWYDFLIRRFRFRNMKQRAFLVYKKVYLSRYGITQWKEFIVLMTSSEKLGEFLYNKYLLKNWCLLILKSLQLNEINNKTYINDMQMRLQGNEVIMQLSSECEEKMKQNESQFSTDIFKMTIDSLVIKIQKNIRRYLALKFFRRYRITALYSIQVMQNFVRIYLSKMKVCRIKRNNINLAALRELEERDLMRDAELDTLYYNYLIGCIVFIQRVFRGWKGREHAVIVAAQYTRDKSKLYYLRLLKDREIYKKYLREKVYRDKKRFAAATEIQRRMRGILARVSYKELKRIANLTRKVILIQKNWRKYLAKSLLQAKIRDAALKERFYSARKVRGLILRCLGFKHRKGQLKAGRILNFLGIDSLSFHHNAHEVISETFDDFVLFSNRLFHELKYFTQHPLNRSMRDTLLQEYKFNTSMGFKKFDAVRIIERGHMYFGYTGLIIRIDTSLPGLPLYEIKLDRFNHKFTYVKMSASDLARSDSLAPLVHINRRPRLRYWKWKSLYGNNQQDPFYRRSNVDAAFVIQRAYRIYRAKKVAARVRYETWIRTAALHASFINQLSDMNSLTNVGDFMTRLINVRPRQLITFNEIHHELFPGRFRALFRVSDESIAVRKEFIKKYQQRMLFLKKCAVIRTKFKNNDSEYFFTGYELLTTFRLLKLLAYATYGKFTSSKLNSDITQNSKMITGLRQYKFKQFIGSPHVRYSKTSIYQGEWSGVPLISPLKPHGEGLVMFFDAWGFSREDKVLYVTIIGCTNLTSSDVGLSDPYCEIQCNSIVLQTSVKWYTLNPIFNESFEIEVTNPQADIHIILRDKDLFSADDFLGQLILPLNEFKDGKLHKVKRLLKGEDIYDKSIDYGEIKLLVQWADKKQRDDVIYLKAQIRCATLIQAWIRKMIARSKRWKILHEREILVNMLKRHAILITSAMRRRLAYKIVRHRRHLLNCVKKIQCRMRIYLSKCKTHQRRLIKYSVIRIQLFWRFIKSSRMLRLLKEQKRQLQSSSIIIMQKFVRRYLSQILVDDLRSKRDEVAIANSGKGSHVKKSIREKERETIANWISTYGKDAVFGLRRTRRIATAAYSRMLQTKYIRMITIPFGVMYLNECSPSLISSPRFAKMFLSAFNPQSVRRYQAIDLINSRKKYDAIVNVDSAIPMLENINFTVCVIQCFWRQYLSRQQKYKMLAIRRGIIIFQRHYRKRFAKLYLSACIIQNFSRVIQAKRYVTFLLLEKRSAIVIQCAYRFHLAKIMEMNLYSVKNLLVLHTQVTSPLSSATESEAIGKLPYLINFEPEKALEHQEHTFWIANSNEYAEMKVELQSKECIASVWIMTSTSSASPQKVSISAILNKKDKKYFTIIDKYPLSLVKGPRWHKIVFSAEGVYSKYFQLIFFDSYGDEMHIAVRQIRFVRSKGISAKILNEPNHVILREGPTIGETKPVKLEVKAVGWPKPAFQWFRNNQPIPDAVEPVFVANLYCPLSNKSRTYRCVKCKMVAKDCPNNAYIVRCLNCSHEYMFKELTMYKSKLQQLLAHEKSLRDYRSKLMDQITQLQKYIKDEEEAKKINPYYTPNPKYPNAILIIEKKIEKISDQINNFPKKRYLLKQDYRLQEEGMVVNHYEYEGKYACQVSNTRANGSIVIMKTSKPCILVCEFSLPFELHVSPYYLPRFHTIRRRWSIYSSIRGNFIKGKLVGLVLINYADGSSYEGPYVGEEWIDTEGNVILEGRAKNHYGIFKCFDGRIFEGPEVDNHFDMHNLQLCYKVTFENGEVYEGQFCDEEFHGHGIFYYSDGSVYEGMWHRGKRFGHGHFRSQERWTYEGHYDSNRRHNKGCITWKDGSMYMGEWKYDVITGHGVYISKLRNVYKGSLVDGKFCGHGEIIYGDGSTYAGEFLNNQRDGLGILSLKDGTQYYGRFINDEKDGEFIVKVIISIAEVGQINYELCIAVFHKGKFLRWKGKFTNETATKTFIRLFQENRDMFNSIYAMILAKNLPYLPDGIDPKHPIVQEIILKIRNESGALISQDVFNDAKNKIKNILIPIKNLEMNIAECNKKLESLKIIESTESLNQSDILRQYYQALQNADKLEMQMEQIWADDPLRLKLKFLEACKAFDKLSKEDFFNLRTKLRSKDVFAQYIMDAICILLNIAFPIHMKTHQEAISDMAYAFTSQSQSSQILMKRGSIAQNASIVTTQRESNIVISSSRPFPIQLLLLSDSTYNSNVPTAEENLRDSEAFIHKYDCKFVFILKSFDLNHYLKSETTRPYLEKILADPRFQMDSEPIVALGVAAPVFVRWIKCANSYFLAARGMSSSFEKLNQVRLDVSRLRSLNIKKNHELEGLKKEQEKILQDISEMRVQLDSFKDELIKANYMLKFVEESYSYFQSQMIKHDYYKTLELQLQEKTIMFEVSTTLQFVIDGVCLRDREDSERNFRRQIADGTLRRSSIEKNPSLSLKIHGNIRDWIKEEVQCQQRSYISLGFNLGFSFEKQSNEVTADMMNHGINLCAESVLGKLNSMLKLPSNTRKWIIPHSTHLLKSKSRVVSSRFIFVLTWKEWKSQAIQRRNDEAIRTWEDIFGHIDPNISLEENCAKMAIISKINQNMSQVAKKQASIWASSNFQIMNRVEVSFANQFSKIYLQDTAEVAVSMSEEIKETTESEVIVGSVQSKLEDFNLSPSASMRTVKSSKASLSSTSVEKSSILMEVKAMCLCWIKYNADDFEAARELKIQGMIKDFEKTFENPFDTCFKILNKLGNSYETKFMQHADHWKAYNLEFYESEAKKIHSNMSDEFISLFPLNSHIEAARLLESNEISKFIQDKEAARQYRRQYINNQLGKRIDVDNEHVMNRLIISAICYTSHNRGLSLKGKKIIQKEYFRLFEKLWGELINKLKNHQLTAVDEDNVSGTMASIFSVNSTLGNLSNSRMHSSKNLSQNLAKQYAWVYGYLLKRHSDLVAELHELLLCDPSTKVFHNVRPSLADKYFMDLEIQHRKRVVEVEDMLSMIMDRISTWNTYFQDGEEVSVYNEEDLSVMTDTKISRA